SWAARKSLNSWRPISRVTPGPAAITVATRGSASKHASSPTMSPPVRTAISASRSSSVRATTLYQPLSNRYTCDPCSPSRSRRSPFSKVSRRPRPVISSRISRGRPPRRLVAGHGLVSVSGRRTGLLRESGGAIRSPRIAVRFVRDAPLGSQWELWSSRLNCRTFSPICRLPRETLPVIQGVRTMARPVAAEPYCARLSGGGGVAAGRRMPALLRGAGHHRLVLGAAGLALLLAATVLAAPAALTEHAVEGGTQRRLVRDPDAVIAVLGDHRAPDTNTSTDPTPADGSRGAGAGRPGRGRRTPRRARLGRPGTPAAGS